MTMTWFISLSFIMALVLAFPSGLKAAVVGRIVQVVGQVDLLKQGKMPSQTAKVEDPVEPGDVLTTKSGAKAQVRFVDDTTLTLASGSRVAIEEYLYDAEKGQRQGVIQVFRGMVQAVVTRVIKAETPDFIMKTHTAVLGVRGTNWYAILGPGGTDVYNEEGKLAVKNILPEFPGEVFLKTMEFCRVATDVPPTVPMAFTQEDLLLLKNQLSTGPGKKTGGSDGLGRSGRSQLSLASLQAVYNPVVNPLNNPTTVTFAVTPVIQRIVPVTPV
jgi:hypothetical protein